jgi:hypothetical protein
MFVSPAGKLFMYMGSGTESDETTTTLAINTTYYVWFYMTRSTLTNGSGWIRVSTSPTMPATNDVSWTGGNIETTASYVNVNAMGFTSQHDEGYNYIVDQALIKTSSIGDVCN